jgi:phage portal protein BeeE
MIKVDSFSFSGYETIAFVEKIQRGEYFVRWGADNMEIERWYQYSMDASPVHSAAIQSKVDNASGKGFKNDYKINGKQYLNDVIKQMFWEFVVSGNLFLEIIWKNHRADGIAGFKVIPSKFMRAKAPETTELTTDTWLFCRDWANYKKAGVIEFKEFNPNDYENRQILHIKQYQPGYLFYGVPTYLSSLLDIRLSRAISEYNLANILNGASPSLWVHLPQAPDSQNEQEDILRRLEDRYRGAQNAGRIVVSYGDPGEKPEITQIQQTLQSGMFSEIFGLVRENILSGHKIPDPSILGLPSPSGFASQAEQLTTAFNLFMNTTIIPLQEFIIRELEPVVQLIYPDEKVKLEIHQNKILTPDDL